jgi:hypothetical protein
MLSEALYGEERTMSLIVLPPPTQLSCQLGPLCRSITTVYPSAPVVDIYPLLFDLPHAGSVLASPAAVVAYLLTAADATSTRPGEAQAKCRCMFLPSYSVFPGPLFLPSQCPPSLP